MKEKDIQEIKSKLIENYKDEKVDEKAIQYIEEVQLLDANDTYYGLTENDVFLIRTEKEIDGKKVSFYDLYNKDGRLIGKSDVEGNLELAEEYKKILKEKYNDLYKNLGLDKRKIEVNEIEKQVDENLKEDKLNEIEEEKDIENGKDSKLEEPEKEKSEELSLEEQEEKMEENLGLSPKDIKSCSEIKDKDFYNRVPEARRYEGYVDIVYVGSTNEFMVVGLNKDTGNYEPLHTVEPSRGIQLGEQSSTRDLGRDGNNIKVESVTSVLRIKGDQEYSLSAKIDGKSSIELKELRYDISTGKSFAKTLETTHQYPSNAEVDKMMNEKNFDVSDENRKYEKLENLGLEKTKKINIKQIEDNAEEIIEDEEKIKTEEVEEEKEDDGEEMEKTIHDHGNRFYY